MIEDGQGYYKNGIKRGGLSKDVTQRDIESHGTSPKP